MNAPRWFHVTAHRSSSALELAREDLGGWLWCRLQAAFPEAIAVVLMPDHLHMIVRSTGARVLQHRVARLLGQLARHFGVAGRARSDVAPPKEIRSRLELSRQVRYVALNPCRRRLAACPLEWPWSTHRDVLGACVDPWVRAPRLAAALGEPVEDFAARHHAYVSGDPHAAIGGTVLPVPASAADMTSRGLACLADAVAAAMRTSVGQIRRRGPARALFVALAYDQGWGHPEQLAKVCGCQPRAIRELVENVPPDALAVARLCLGDARLLRLPAPAPRVTRPGTHQRDPRGPVKAPLALKGLGPALGRE